MRAYSWRAAFLLALCASVGRADISIWKLGGSGGAWSERDTSQVLIDFASVPGAIQPVYLSPEQNILPLLSNWSEIKFPQELGYIDGHRPRIWRAADGRYYVASGTRSLAWIDGDSLTYSPPVLRGGLVSEWYTIDLGVPVPADRFGFFTPPQGFSADGKFLADDIVKAFEVSVSEELSPLLADEKDDGDYHRLETLIADIPENLQRDVSIRFPKQYIRLMRFQYKQSSDDDRFLNLFEGIQKGTIGDFVLTGEGVPKRGLYTTQIIDLGNEVNFGRLFWSATPMRFVDGVSVEAADAQVALKVEVRSGRDEDPNIYHEYTDAGDEDVVSRQRYENELRERAPLRANAGILQPGKPGLRASITYDTENWTYWSSPVPASGAQTGLERGRYLQVKLALESSAFSDFIRLDSLWIEQSPVLAGRVVGEVARLDDPHPERGFARVVLGETTEFSYDIAADFTAQSGFDALRIRTGSRTLFNRLEVGDPPIEVEPVQVVEEEGGLLVHLPQKITPSHAVPLRVVFATAVFALANTFSAEVFDTQSFDLPQPVEMGNASERVSTSSLQVWGRDDEAQQMLRDLRFSTPVLTPNGDGIHDQLAISYALFNLPISVPVELVIYGLDGGRIACVEAGQQRAGPQQIRWNGRDTSGQLLAPGVYLLEVVVESEFRTFRHVQSIGIAY